MRPRALSDDDLRDLFARLNDFELLGLWARLMTELNGRGVIRSDNNPIGDYCEFQVAAHYGVKPAGNSNAGHDLTSPDGSRIQVKGRRRRADSCKPPYFSGARNLSDEPPPFDFLIGLILNRDFSVHEAWQLPVERVRHYATYRKHTNSWSLPTIRGAMLEDPQVRRIELQVAARLCSAWPARRAAGPLEPDSKTAIAKQTLTPRTDSGHAVCVSCSLHYSEGSMQI